MGPDPPNMKKNRSRKKGGQHDSPIGDDLNNGDPVPGSKLPMLGMVISPLIGNLYNGYINPYYWVDDHPLLYGNNGILDPSTDDLSTYVSST